MHNSYANNTLKYNTMLYRILEYEEFVYFIILWLLNFYMYILQYNDSNKIIVFFIIT